MKLNADFTRRAVVLPDEYDWKPSPVEGVERMMLDRIGGEVARATSLVRYAPDSEFPSHEHGGGEEILVLEGEFADEHGSYPAGTYIRNPIGSHHRPRVGAQGCVIFVKLHQHSENETSRTVIDAGTANWQSGTEAKVLPLHALDRERVTLMRLEPGREFRDPDPSGGEEILVLEGVLRDDLGSYPAGSWIRNPPGEVHALSTTGGPALIYRKTGHLSGMGARNHL
ncbi:cupin domain-containing protein [Microbulbifer yueqingensis]|uniref:Anti-ECFsigma factor, ChrR n=1 Tax=Microbulbifer yueqingensis TaxID=658219 RepID=A0A1G8XT60_9GAMM|nr:cupin domain-containing protein [Microbulbifer yueqingensis]SDJ93741.1 anti-ECFsigma factor, ChrR [Microbulbifer yueqingensis]